MMTALNSSPPLQPTSGAYMRPYFPNAFVPLFSVVCALALAQTLSN